MANMSDPSLEVEGLAAKMYMSRMTLYRKIKALSPLSPAELVNVSRLKKAAELMAAGEHRINEVADKVGFSSPGSFTRNFHRQFNMTPTEYLQSRAHGAAR